MKKVDLHRMVLAGLLVLSACQSVDKKENDKLERQLDSVSNELTETRQELMDSRQVKALLDSIDASRNVVSAPSTMDNDSQSNLTRLNDINEYVRDINLKMDQMEKSIKYVNTMAASILTLQADIDARTLKIARLEAEAKNISTNDKSMISTIQRKDSTMALFIKNCQGDIAVLQKAMEDVHTKNNLATADLYFKQAETLTGLAENVGSSAKKKFVKREALEMYKISFSLGKKEAQSKIKVLEADL